MSCPREAIFLIHKYYDEEITPEEEKRLRHFLQTSQDCQEHFQELKKTIAIIQSANHITAPEGFTERVMQSLPKEKRVIGYQRWFRSHPLITAAAVFLLLMSGSLFSTWNNDQDLSVSTTENVQIKNDTVIVPEGRVVNGDLIVKNGNLKIEGEVHGDVVVINGEQYLASAGNVTGEMEEINAVFDWIWYNMKGLVKEVWNMFKGE